MTIADWSIAFGLGVAGSLHCTQMCGPLVIAMGSGQVFYNMGRILTYGLLGAFAGAAGSLGVLPGVERWVAIVGGFVIAGVGLWKLGPAGRPALIQLNDDGFARRLLRQAAGLLTREGTGARFRLGLLLGLMPCGLVWAALVKAASTANAADGFATMIGFGAGTAVALLGCGLLSTPFRGRFTRHGARLAALAMIVAGLFVAWRGYSAGEEGQACHGTHQT